MPIRIDETWYQRPPGTPDRTSAGGVVTRWDGSEALIALAREAHWPQFILPKGGVERGETLEQAARREILEEAGLMDLHLIRPLDRRERLDFRKRRWITTHYFLFATCQVKGAPTDRHHHYALGWYPLARLPELLWPEQAELLATHAEEIASAARRFGTGSV
jgi:8-oxo-dGTP pyrophosphatase MutT (NUDIX family)